MRALAPLLVVALVGLAAAGARAGEDHPISALAAIGVGSVEESGYGGSVLLGAGWQFDEVFALAAQGGVGVTETAGVGPERFAHGELLVPARLNICASDSWACPGSTFDLVASTGFGASRFLGRWAPNVVVGVAFDSYRRATTDLDVGLRVGVLGYYDVTEPTRMAVMLQLVLGVAVRFA